MCTIQFTVGEQTNKMLNILEEFRKTNDEFAEIIYKMHGDNKGDNVASDYFAIFQSVEDFIFEQISLNIQYNLSETGKVAI